MKQTKQKTTSKKTFFFFFRKQSKVSKKKTKCLLCLCLSFKKSLRTTEVQHLFFFSETSNPEVVSCTNNKVFFSFFSSFTRKQSFQLSNCFFLCEQNHSKMRNRNQATKKLNWSFFLFVHSFRLLPLRQQKKNALLEK